MTRGTAHPNMFVRWLGATRGCAVFNGSAGAVSQQLASNADSGRSRPRIRDDVADQSDLMSLGVPR